MARLAERDGELRIVIATGDVVLLGSYLSSALEATQTFRSSPKPPGCFDRSFIHHDDVLVRTHSSRDATKLSEFFHDREVLLLGDLSVEDFEAKWRGVHVAGQELFADAAEIFRMANAGALKVERLYSSPGGAR